MRFFNDLRGAGPALLLFAILTGGACTKSHDASVIGTFKMGETVQAGPLTYHVMESQWTQEIPNVANRPSDRYLLVKLDAKNDSERSIPLSGFTLLAPDGKSYSEVTQGVTGASGWLGLLRHLEPRQKVEGVAIFDAPIGKYQLVLSDGGEVGSEKYVHVEIPADIG